MGNQTFARSQDMKTLVLLTIVAFACATPATEDRKQRQGTPWTPSSGASRGPASSGSREGLHRMERHVHQEVDYGRNPRIARPRAMGLHRNKRQEEFAMDPKIASASFAV